MQTTYGTPPGIAARCATAGKPLRLIVGEDALPDETAAVVVSVEEAGTLEAFGAQPRPRRTSLEPLGRAGP